MHRALGKITKQCMVTSQTELQSSNKSLLNSLQLLRSSSAQTHQITPEATVPPPSPNQPSSSLPDSHHLTNAATSTNPTNPAESITNVRLQALNYHRQFFDDSPEGQELHRRWKLQFKLETDVIQEAISTYKRDLEQAMKRGEGATIPTAKKLFLRWMVPMKERIKKEQDKLNAMKEKRNNRHRNRHRRIREGDAWLFKDHNSGHYGYEEHLLALPAETLAVITMHSAINALSGTRYETRAMDDKLAGTTRLGKLALAIGQACEFENSIQMVKMILDREKWLQNQVYNVLHCRAALMTNDQLLGGDEIVGEEMVERRRFWMKRRPDLVERYNQTRKNLLAAFEDDGDKYEQILSALPEDAGLLVNMNEEAVRDLAAAGNLKLGEEDKKLLQRASRLNSDKLKESFANSRVLQRAEALAKKHHFLGDEPWNAQVKAKLGVALVKMLIDSCLIDVRQPNGSIESISAFYHRMHATTEQGKKRTVGMIDVHEQVINQLTVDGMKEAFVPKFLPMIIEPVPWQRYNVGGYLTHREKIMRYRGNLHEELLQEKDKEMVEGRGPGLSRVYEAVTALGKVPWSINNEILQVMQTIFQLGGGVCAVPPLRNKPLPPPPRKTFGMHRDDGGNLRFHALPNKEIKDRYMDINKTRKVNKELHSIRCDFQHKLRVAQEFAVWDRFYCPHNLDFRGRAYPLPPHLNHLGSDISRGLLLFADRKPLGSAGLKWLYVQAANLWGNGVDKFPLQGRVEWVEKNLGTVLENAQDPLRSKSTGGSAAFDKGNNIFLDGLLGDINGGNSVYTTTIAATSSSGDPLPRWHKAEEPFQFLATCIEIRNALASGDPSTYKSNLPIHQDGSCNGLQHYAAMGRDLSGGAAVNLLPSDGPQDVYTQMADRVDAKIRRDRANGVWEAQLLLDSLGGVDRKLVKQTVMTSVYGVTFVGARNQIANRLKERGFADSREMFKVSSYAARITLDELAMMFSEAKGIMNWLGAVAAEVVQKTGETVTWTTPLGLPIMQPYRNKETHEVSTVMQSISLLKEEDERKLKVTKTRQKSAFAPNFVHSLDSTHMMMTAIECSKRGIAFAGVHDSFWTHAGDIERMNKILRDQFIKMHKQDILGKLKKELETKYKEKMAPATSSASSLSKSGSGGGYKKHNNNCFLIEDVPKRGDLNLDDLKESVYFFS